MRSEHERFVSLAGAIALGEATADERERYDAHAADCAACRDYEIEELMAVRERITLARLAESWRPSVGSALLSRIRNERLHRSRLTLQILSWSVALSLALEAAFVSGLTSYAAGAFHTTGTSMANIAASYRTAAR